MPGRSPCAKRKNMKTFLAIVVLILTGLVFWVRYVSVRPTEAHREIIAGLKEELEDSRAERDQLVVELSKTKAALERARAAAPTAVFDEPTSPASGAAPDSVNAATGGGAASAPVPATTLEARLTQLGEIYHRNHSALLEEKATLEASLESVRAKRKLLVDTPMKFSEQTIVTDPDGNITGFRGVRTSDADRQRAFAKRDDRLALMDGEIKELVSSIVRSEAGIKRLDELYQNAVAKAKAEMAAP